MVIVKCDCFLCICSKKTRATLKMIMLEQSSNTFLYSFISDLLFGLNFFAFNCLPYIIVCIAVIGSRFKKGVIVMRAQRIWKSKSCLKEE